jgi:hypothetical protein
MQASQNKIFLPFLVPSQWKANTLFWVMISEVSVSMQENLFIDKYSLSLQMSDDDIFIIFFPDNWSTSKHKYMLTTCP